MIDLVKQALRITSSAFDTEIELLINGALADIGITGASVADADPLVQRAVVTYCKANFGDPDGYDKFKASYDEQKAQLQSCSRYWEVAG